MITVYSKDNCVQCMQAEGILKAKGKDFVTMKLDEDYTREYLSEICQLAGKPEPRSFPVIFKDGGYVGSLQDLKMQVARGTL